MLVRQTKICISNVLALLLLTHMVSLAKVSALRPLIASGGGDVLNVIFPESSN